MLAEFGDDAEAGVVLREGFFLVPGKRERVSVTIEWGTGSGGNLGGTDQFFAMMPLPRGFRAFLRRTGMVVLARDERRLRF